MKDTVKLLVLLFLSIGALACTDEGENDNEQQEEGLKIELLPDQKYDKTINGVHVIMEYRIADKYFKGSMQNVTSETISGVQLNIHLSNGMILALSSPNDLQVDAYETSVIIDAEVKEWDKWGLELTFDN